MDTAIWDTAIPISVLAMLSPLSVFFQSRDSHGGESHACYSQDVEEEHWHSFGFSAVLVLFTSSLDSLRSKGAAANTLSKTLRSASLRLAAPRMK